MALINKRRQSGDEFDNAPSGKRRCDSLAGPTLLTYPTNTTNSKHPRMPLYAKPQLDFQSIFACVAPFRDALRLAGGLTAYEYGRLRMTCRTVAEEWKPYPYEPLQPDSKDPYFAGIRPVQCQEIGCFRDSSTVPVRRCYGKYHPMAGVFCGCNKFICGECVWKAQQEYVHRKTQETEMHYCRPCSRRIKGNNPNGLPQCDCSFNRDENTLHQDYTDWQCMSCRAAFYRFFERKARENLKQLEESECVLPRSWEIDPNGPGLERWISKPGQNRNNCPDCGKWYRRLMETYGNGERINHFLPPSMLRRCMVCLGQRTVEQRSVD